MGGSPGCYPLCSGLLHSCLLLSPPTDYHWESIISLSVSRQNRGACCFFFRLHSLCPVPKKHLAASETCLQSNCRYRSGRCATALRVRPVQLPPPSVSLYFCVFLSSISRHTRVYGEWRGVVWQPVWRKAGSSEPRAKCRCYSNQLSGCGPTVSMSC